MSAHRVLRDFFRAYDSVGLGIGVDPGNAKTITPEMWGQLFLIKTAGAETRTLARPNRPGILTSIVLDTDGGDLTLTVTGGYDAAGDTSLVFADAGDMAVFMSVKTGTTYQWTMVSHEGTDASLFIGGTAITATAAEINAAADVMTQAIVAPGAITVDGTVNRVTITNAVNGAITLAAPSTAMVGKILMIEYIGAGTNATTLALTNVVGGTAATSASFNAADESLTLIGGATKWHVLGQAGVTLS